MPPALPDGQAHAAAAAAGGAEGKEKARRRACEDAAKWKSQGAMWKEAARKRAQEAERLAALYGVIERNEELKQQLKSEIAETDAALTKCAVQLSSAVAGADDAALERALREEEAQLERELAGYAARLRSGLEAFGECATARLPLPAPTHAARALPPASRGPAPPAEARASPPSGPPSPPPPLDESAPLHVCILTGVDEHLDAQGVVDLVRIKTGHVPIRAAFYKRNTNAPKGPANWVLTRRFIVAMASEEEAKEVERRFRKMVGDTITTDGVGLGRVARSQHSMEQLRNLLNLPGAWVLPSPRACEDTDAGTSEEGSAVTTLDRLSDMSSLLVFRSDYIRFSIREAEAFLKQLVEFSSLREHSFVMFGRSTRGLVLEMESPEAAREFREACRRKASYCHHFSAEQAKEFSAHIEQPFARQRLGVRRRPYCPPERRVIFSSFSTLSAHGARTRFRASIAGTKSSHLVTVLIWLDVCFRARSSISAWTCARSFCAVARASDILQNVFSRLSRRTNTTLSFCMSFGPISHRSGTPRISQWLYFQPGV